MFSTNRRRPLILIGCLCATLFLWMMQRRYANVISDSWYAANLLFWGSWFVVMWRSKGKENLRGTWIIFAITVLVLLGAYLMRLPAVSYSEAADVLADQVDGCKGENLLPLMKYHEMVWDDTDCDRRHKNYLMAFDGEPIRFFWFDPYSGAYGDFDAEEFSFIQEAAERQKGAACKQKICLLSFRGK